ncbi:MAG: hypothetical protein ABR955_15630 [Verrucomicrobiota bacterium]|jgi:hypothetical protein
MGRDYILRMVDQIAAMLAGVIAKKQAGQPAEARAELEKTCIQTIGLTLADLKRLSPEAVVQLLNNAGALRPIRAVTLAELLLVDAELHEADPDALPPLPNYVHAFCLLADAIDTLTTEDQAIYRTKLNMLADRLGDLRTHPYIKEKLRDYGTAKNA